MHFEKISFNVPYAGKLTLEGVKDKKGFYHIQQNVELSYLQRLFEIIRVWIVSVATRQLSTKLFNYSWNILRGNLIEAVINPSFIKTNQCHQGYLYSAENIAEALKDRRDFAFHVIQNKELCRSEDFNFYISLTPRLQADHELAFSYIFNVLPDPHLGLWGVIPKSLRANDKFMLAAVQKNDRFYESCEDNLKNSRPFNLSVLPVNMYLFKKFPPSHRTDRDFVLQAVDIKPEVLSLLPEDSPFRNDEGIIRAAIKKDGTVIRHAHKDLQKRPEIALEAITQNKDAFGYHFLCDNKEFMLTCINVHGIDVTEVVAKKELGKDPDIISALAALKAKAAAT